jgi:hypothetical protein
MRYAPENPSFHGQSFSIARRTLEGTDAVHVIQNGRAEWVGQGDPLAQLQFIDESFGLAI